MGNTKHPVTAADRRKAIRMRNAGMSYREIAKTLNRPLGTISGIVSLAILRGQLDYTKDLDPAVRRKSE